MAKISDQILGTYSPEDVIIVLSRGGDVRPFSHVVNGYADGTFVSMTRSVPHATLYTGADASNVRVVRAVRNYDITLSLHQSSETNDVLSTLLRNDEDSRDGSDIFQITIKDASGRTVASSNSAFVGTTPDVDYGTDISERAWVIHSTGMDIHEGGNGKFTSSTFTTLAELGYEPDPYWNPVSTAG